MNELIKEKLDEIKDILETCPLHKVSTKHLYDVIMEVIDRDNPAVEDPSSDPTWEFDNSQPIIHLDDNPLDNHIKTMASMIKNLTKNK